TSTSPSSSQASPGGRSVASTCTTRVQQVARVAVDQLAHVVGLEERAREPERGRCSGVEGGPVAVRQLEVEGPEVLVELRHAADADERHDLRAAAVQQPGDRDLRSGAAELRGDLADG